MLAQFAHSGALFLACTRVGAFRPLRGYESHRVRFDEEVSHCESVQTRSACFVQRALQGILPVCELYQGRSRVNHTYMLIGLVPRPNVVLLASRTLTFPDRTMRWCPIPRSS